MRRIFIADVSDRFRYIKSFLETLYQTQKLYKQNLRSKCINPKINKAIAPSDTQVAKYLACGIPKNSKAFISIPNELSAKASHEILVVSKDFNLLQNRLDEIDVQIAHHDIEKAFNNIERGHQVISNMESGTITANIMGSKLADRSGRLVKLIVD